MSQNTKTQLQPTETQRKNLGLLKENFGLSDAELSRCLFFNRDQEEPWIPPDITIAISRQVPSIRHFSPAYEKFVQELQQVVFSATVVDVTERSFTRIGIAKIGEKPNGLEIDAAVLAEGRALNAALNSAGVNPFKAGAVTQITRLPGNTPPAPLSEEAKRYFNVTDEAMLRTKDLRQIHATAEEKGLIRGKDMRLYRDWLNEHFGTRTAATLSAEQRAQVINLLNTDDSVQLIDVPVEYREDALIA